MVFYQVNKILLKSIRILTVDIKSSSKILFYCSCPGILTGSLFLDRYLYAQGFTGESCKDGSMLVVKNHFKTYQTVYFVEFGSIVLLIRNPKDSILVSNILIFKYSTAWFKFSYCIDGVH